jgi:hypothetical protein
MNPAFVLVALLMGAAQAPSRLAIEERLKELLARPPVAPGTASIEGRVIDAVSEKPIDGAEVSLIEWGRQIPPGSRPGYSTTVANRDGVFTFRDIAAGAYQLTAYSKRHLRGCVGTALFGTTPQGCVEARVEAAQQHGGVIIALTPGATIAGTIVDHEDHPLPNVSVVAKRIDEHRVDQLVGMNRSDVNGRFEFAGIAPGPVQVSVETMHADGAGLVRVFYPGVLAEREAEPVAVEAASAIEIALRVPRVTAFDIIAQVFGPPGFTVDGVTLMRPETMMRLPISLTDGVGSVINLRQGNYVVTAHGTAGGDPLAAFALVDLRDNVELSLQLLPTGTVTGRLIIERGGLPPVDGVRVAAVWTDGAIPIEPRTTVETGVGPDAVFRLDNLFGTRLFKVVGLPNDWHVTAIRAGRTDITSSGLEIASGSITDLTIVVARR